MNERTELNYTLSTGNALNMMNLVEEVENIQNERLHSDDTILRLRRIVEESSRMISDANVPHELVFDAKIIETGSRILRENIQAFDTNIHEFNEQEYVWNVIELVENDWESLAREVCGLFRAVPQMEFMLGSFKLEEPPPIEKKRERSVRQKTEIAEKHVLGTTEQLEQEEDATDKLCEHVYACLVHKYKQSGKQAVNYLEFIVDPDDFWRTIQNIFHFSFLVRDGKAAMTFNKQGLPMVEPKSAPKAASGEDALNNNQFNFRLTRHEWQQIVAKFDIKTPTIKPLAF